MARWITRTRAGILAILAAPLWLVGCAGIHLYDPGREATAKDVKTRYSELNPPGVFATEEQNLTALLDEELAVIREAHSLRLDLALLRIVDGDEPIGTTITGLVADKDRPNSFARRVIELGYPDFAKLRAFLTATDLLSSRDIDVRVRDDPIYAMAGVRAPPCGAPDSDKTLQEVLERVTAVLKRTMLEKHIDTYKTNCKEYLEAQAQREATLGDGEVSRAYRNWQRAQTALARQRARAQGAAREEVVCLTAPASVLC